MRIVLVAISASLDSMGQRLLTVQKHLSSTHYRNPFSTVLAVTVIGKDLFH